MKTIFGGKTGMVLLLLVVLLLAGLPVAVWLDLTNLAETNLKRQASDLNSIISSVRSYYASNVVGRILAAPGVPTQVVHNYEDDPGRHSRSRRRCRSNSARSSASNNTNITYRFVSDYPFENRAPHPLDEFRGGCARRAARKSRINKITDDIDVAFRRPGAPGRAGDHGRALRRLPQHASGKPQARLEGRRRPRHPGSHHHPADRRQHLFASSTCSPISR